jgi:hypothetical protein
MNDSETNPGRRLFLAQAVSAIPLLPALTSAVVPRASQVSQSYAEMLLARNHDVRTLTAKMSVSSTGPDGTYSDKITDFQTGPGTLTIVENGFLLEYERYRGRLRLIHAILNRRYAKYGVDTATGKVLRVEAAGYVRPQTGRKTLVTIFVPVLDGVVGVQSETDRYLVLKNADRELVVDKQDNVVVRNRRMAKDGGYYQQTDYGRFTTGPIRVPTSVTYQNAGLRQVTTFSNVRVNMPVDSSVIGDALDVVA